MNQKFPILAWPVDTLSEKNIKQVKLWKEMGITINIGNRFDAEKQDKSLMLKLLDECEKYDIKLIIYDTRTVWQGAAEDPEQYRKNYKAAYQDFGEHPATYGFLLGDEPYKKDMPDLITALKIQLEEAPHLLPFFNLFPIWPTSNPPYVGYGELASYFQDIRDNLPAKILSYDRYSQMNDDEEGVETYFHDMRHYYNLTREMNIPLWTCLLSAGHWNYMSPDEASIRWQLNTALAGGCKGIIWFTLNELLQANFRDAPINLFGEKSPTFYSISHVCRRFLASTADIFKELTLDECYHVGRTWGGYPQFNEGVNDKLLSVTSLTDTDMIVSFYTHANGEKYLAVVNNSKTKNNNNFNLTFNMHKCNPKEISMHGEMVNVFEKYPNKEKHNFDPRLENNVQNEEKDRFTVNLWACAGQLYLFKF